MKALLLTALLLSVTAAPGQIIVQPGDTLFRLAERHLGSGARYPELAAANNLSAPFAIVAGQVLQLPDSSAATAPHAAAPVATAVPAVGAAPAAAAIPALNTTLVLPPLTATAVKDGAGLTLAEALSLAGANNLSLRSGRISPLTAAQSVIVADAAFDPTLTAEVRENWSRSNQEKPDNTFSSRSDNRAENYATGVSSTLREGTQVGVSLSSSHSRTAPGDAHSSGADVALTITQPLLEGAGREVVEGSLSSARQSHAAAVATAARLDEETALAVENAYWSLAQAEASEQISRSSLTVAEALLAHNEQLLARGLLAQVEVLTARSGVATRRESLVSTRLTRENNSDALAFLMLGERAAQDRALYRTVSVPVSTAMPDSVAVLEERALAARTDLTAARASLAAAEIDLRVRENALLPDLSLSAGAGTGGSAVGFNDAWADLGESREPNWSLGLSLSIPLGNAADKARFESAKLTLEQRRLALVQTENTIRKAVRDAHRSVAQGLTKLATATESRRLSEELLQAELSRLELGLTTTQNVLTAEEDTAQARLTEAQARYTLAAARAELAAALGDAR
ncbi:MAG TPA: TolC family protein [bacterium]|nr:TolC family protein [bacterium]